MRRALALSLLLLLPLRAGDDGPCGQLPEGKPQRIKGGESFPPLPLPATPLRRSERKREPAPPTLIGKVVWGQNRVRTLPDGRKQSWADWNLDPNDVHRLLKVANGKLGIRYRAVTLYLKAFAWDPCEVPILYFTGRVPLELDDETLGKLREYVFAGGTVWADACHGSAAFADSFRALMARAFPDLPMVRLAADHPVFWCQFACDKLRYSPAVVDRPKGDPVLEGIWVGCRTAVLLTPYDLSCAWDSSHCDEGARCVLDVDAFHLGMNMIAYALAYFPLGRAIARARELSTDAAVGPGDFVFAQVRHAGHWDPDPGAFANLVKEVIEKTSTRVNVERKALSLADPAIANHPFLYMTGHDGFALTREEVEGLRGFLESGGVLLADACCGSLEFDAAFRSAMKLALPEAELARLAKDHPVFTSHSRVERVAYTERVLANFPGLEEPYLEGIEIDGSTRVLYSRFDLGCGWEGEDHPWASGVRREDALRIGINAVVYALTH